MVMCYLVLSSYTPAQAAVSSSAGEQAVSLEWSDGEEISLTLTGSNYKDVSHGDDTTYAFHQDGNDKTINFSRPGFGDISVSYWYGSSPNRYYTVYVAPDPADVASKADRLPVQMEWSDGKTIDITLITQDDEGYPSYDADSVEHGNETKVVYNTAYDDSIEYEIIYYRDDFGIKLLHAWQDDAEGVYYQVQDLPTKHEFTFDWGDGTDVSISPYIDTGSFFGMYTVLYTDLDRGTDVEFTDEVIQRENARKFTFSRPGYGDIYIYCDSSMTSGIVCDSYRNPEPTEPETVSPPMSHDVESEWSDEQEFSVTVGADTNGDLTYVSSNITKGSDTEVIEPSSRSDHVPNSKYVSFKRPSFGYQAVQWWHDSDKGVYYQVNERPYSKEIEVEWADEETTSLTINYDPSTGKLGYDADSIPDAIDGHFGWSGKNDGRMYLHRSGEGTDLSALVVGPCLRTAPQRSLGEAGSDGTKHTGT